MIISFEQVEATVADAGWYPDPQDRAALRYFDGSGWTEHTRAHAAPAAAQQQSSPPPAQQPAAPYGNQQYGQQQQQYSPQSQQYGQQQPYPQQSQQYGGYAPTGGAGAWDQPPAGRRRRPGRKVLLIALAAVVVIAAGLITFFTLSGDDPQFTYGGKPIASASTVLSTAQDEVDAVVKRRHGATDADTRCYFTQPKKASGTKKTDVGSTLRCGPVLFVDGDTARQYLPVPLHRTSSKGGQVKLAPAQALTGVDPVAVADDVKLARPDGKSAPQGSGGLKAPAPPAAAANTLTAADLGTTTAPRTLSGAVMGSKSTTVTLLAAGQISRYGTGDTARSAPSGQELIAFKVKYSGGELSNAASDEAKLSVSGAGARALPDVSGDQWIVAAVPSAGPAALTLDADGYTQSLSLPGGKRGANNIAVLSRTHHTAFLFKSFDVPIKLSERGASGSGTVHGRATAAALDFWIPEHTEQHARSTKDAILSIGLSATFKGKSTQYAFDAPLLKLRLPNGRTVAARDVAAGDRVQNVFEVPADFTRGTLLISGSEKSGKLTLRVAKSASVNISIPAG